MIQSIAEFWSSRVQLETINSETFYVINGVIPPDEYHFGNNSVFTNAVAQLSLDFAIELSEYLGMSYPSIWKKISQNLYFPFNTSNQIYLEYDSYNGSVIKQADVILLSFPLEWKNLTPEIAKNNLEYYSNRTDGNGPAMTWSMTALGYLDLGEPQTAQEYFLKSFLNIQVPFDVWTETPTGGTTNFITGAGGFLQSVVFGYGGIRIVGLGVLEIRGVMYEGVKEMKMSKIGFLGQTIQVKLTEDKVEVRLVAVGKQSTTVLSVEQQGSTTQKLVNVGDVAVVQRSVFSYVKG